VVPSTAIATPSVGPISASSSSPPSSQPLPPSSSSAILGGSVASQQPPIVVVPGAKALVQVRIQLVSSVLFGGTIQSIT
jgi:hypothetical protein